MIWTYDDAQKVWNLMENDAITARIFLKNKEKQKKQFLAKSLIPSIYTSSKTFNKLTRSNKSWKTTNKKFKTNEEREQYIDIKKREIIKYIKNFI